MFPGITPYVMGHIDRLLADNQFFRVERVIDVGCGMGKFTIPLAAKGLPIEGLDLSPYLLRELEKANNSGSFIPTHIADILAPPTALQKKFDAVCGFFMLHHVIDLKQAFKGVQKLIKPGGTIAFIDVNGLCPLYYLQVILTPSMRWKAEKGIIQITKKKLTNALRQTGFVNIRINNYGLLPPLLKNCSLVAPADRLSERIPIIQPFSSFTSISAKAPEVFGE